VVVHPSGSHYHRISTCSAALVPDRRDTANPTLPLGALCLPDGDHILNKGSHVRCPTNSDRLGGEPDSKHLVRLSGR